MNATNTIQMGAVGLIALTLAGMPSANIAAQTSRTRVAEVQRAEAAAAAAAPKVSGRNIVMVNSADGENQAVEIRIEGDSMRVFRNGKQVPQEQILEKDDSLIITDKDGNPLQTVQFRLQRHSGETAPFYGRWLTDQSNNTVWTGQELPKVMLGVHMAAPGAALEKHLRLEADSTTMISGVYEGLPAYEAGLREYDIITKVDGESPATDVVIREKLQVKKPNEVISFSVIQSGKPTEIKVTLVAYDAEAFAKAKLLGAASDDIWTRIAGVPDGQALTFQTLKNLPMLVAPQAELRNYFEDIKPKFEELRLRTSEAASKSRVDLEQRLQQLNERLAEMDKRIQKLLDRNN